MYKNFFKRLFDIIGALSAIPFVLLISLFVGLAIYIEDRGDIFYLASRRGRYGEIFKMFKFRSMKMNARISVTQIIPPIIHLMIRGLLKWVDLSVKRLLMNYLSFLMS